MSKTLRRPMFRGGPVDSYSTGITSGLDDSGYADGGRVSAKIGGFFSGLFNRGKTTIPGVQNNPPLSGFALKQNTPTSTSLPSIDYLDLIGVGDFAKAARPYLANPAIGIPALGYGAYEIGRLPGRLTDSGYEIEGGEEEKFIKDFGGEILGKETSTGEAITGYYLTKNQKRAEDLLKRGEPGDKEMAEKLIKSSTPQKPEKQPESELDKLKKFYEDQILSERNKYESQLAGLKTTPLTEEEDIIKQTQLYQKLLGGDEAKSQAVYDALLAASPAFFKGRNLREAAPEVLTAINKSGAFDKPRDIRQAAAQLSIQRAMLKDKAIAEEKARLGQIQLAGEGKKDSVAAQLKELTGSGAIIGNITPDKLQQAVKDYPVGSNLRVVDPTTKRTSFIRIVSQKNSKGETIKSFEEYLI
jgi:hypothetical protein